MDDASERGGGGGVPERAGTVSARELYERLVAGERVSLLDVRDREDFEAWHIDGPNAAVAQVPYVKAVQANVTDGVADLVGETELDEPIVVVCARGEASAEVAGYLTDAGIEAANLADGMEGWARVYVAHELAVDEATVVQYERPATGCLSYLVRSGDEAAVVDPLRAFADRYVEDAGEATLRWAVDTHVHADHVSGVRDVARATDATAVLPAGAEDRGLAFEATLLDDGEELAVGETALRAVHAPGHTSELTALRLGGTLFSADALFLDGVGRPDLEAGADGAASLARALYATLRERLLALPDGTLVAPGHVAPERAMRGGPHAATLGSLRERLSLLGVDEATFVERVVAGMGPQPANYEEILDINLGRASAEDAARLELGPNNCAVSAD